MGFGTRMRGGRGNEPSRRPREVGRLGMAADRTIRRARDDTLLNSVFATFPFCSDYNLGIQKVTELIPI